jgi:hypothetical protein
MRVILVSLIVLFTARLHAQMDSCDIRWDLTLRPSIFYDTVLNSNISKQTTLDIAHRDSIVVGEKIKIDSVFSVLLHYSFNACVVPRTYKFYRVEIGQRPEIQPMSYCSLHYSQRTENLDSFRFQLLVDSFKVLYVCVYINTFNIDNERRLAILNRESVFRNTNLRMNEASPRHKSNCLIIFEQISKR